MSSIAYFVGALPTAEIQRFKTDHPELRVPLAQDGSTNPLRKKTKFGYGQSGIHPSDMMTEEDVLFANIGRRDDCVCMTQVQSDGTIKVTLPLGTPPDQAAKFYAFAKNRERKEKAKKRCRDALERKSESKSESKVKTEETHEEMMVRYKAMCDLVGPDEAAKMMDADFWTA
jgi:hypothetical protein